MNRLHRLSKVTGKLYLAMFLAALVCMLINTLYICVDRSGVRPGESIESKITADINEAIKGSENNSYALPVTGLDMSEGISDKMDEMFGFLAAMAGIVFLLFMREISFTDTRTREFEQTLPVKKTTLVMHEYWFFFVLILGVTLLQGFVLMGYQTHYNEVWVRTAGIAAPTGFNSVPEGKLFVYILMYAFSLIIGYTWIYLGMTVCRNSLLGGAASIGMWAGMVFAYDNLGYGLADFLTRIIAGGYPGTVGVNGELIPDGGLTGMVWEQKRYFIDGVIELILEPQYRFWYLRDIINHQTYGNGIRYIFNRITAIPEDDMSFVAAIGIMAAALIIGIVLIWIAAKTRQLSKGGRLSYFTAVEYMAALLCGLVWYVFLTEYLAYDMYVSSWFIIFSTLTVTAAVALLIHPIRFKKRISYIAEQGAYTGRFLKEERGELAKLLYYDGRRIFIALMAEILAIYVFVSSMFSDGSIMYYDDADIAECLSHAPYEISFYFENISDDILNHFHLRIIGVVMAVLLISKLFEYWQERNGDTRSFLETFPIRRKNKAAFSAAFDLLVTIIPVIFAGIYVYVRMGKLLAGANIELEWLGSSMRGIVITDVAYIVMLVGLLHFMEELFPNGLMRVVGFAAGVMMTGYALFSLCMAYVHSSAVQFVYGLLSLGLPGNNYPFVNALTEGVWFAHSYIDVPVLFRGSLLQYYNSVFADSSNTSSFGTLYDFSKASSYIGYAFFYLTAGAVLLVIACIMAQKKEMSRSGFYFEFGRYIFAGMIAFTMLCITRMYVVAVWHIILVDVSCAIMFALFIYLMIPSKRSK